MSEKKRRRRRLIRNRKAEIAIHFLGAGALVFAAVYLVLNADRIRLSFSGAAPAETREAPESEESGALSLFIEELAAGADSAEEPAADPYDGSSPPSEEAKIRQVPKDQIVETDMSGDWRLILVNPSHRLPSDFEADTCLVWEEEDEDHIGDNDRIDWRIYDEVHEMLRDCERAGFSPVIRSAYRSSAQQKELFEAKVDEFLAKGQSREEAEENAATIIALPGTSEHELGLALDIVDSRYGVLSAAQENTGTQMWLMEHCWEYGFILRYPTDKGGITGIIYEPWHYRFVGKQAAKIIHSQNLCLEEYLYEFGNGGNSDGET